MHKPLEVLARNYSVEGGGGRGDYNSLTGSPARPVRPPEICGVRESRERAMSVARRLR
jgi:hypothetical protein